LSDRSILNYASLRASPKRNPLIGVLLIFCSIALGGVSAVSLMGLMASIDGITQWSFMWMTMLVIGGAIMCIVTTRMANKYFGKVPRRP
jgi:hypothetical protein